MSHPTLFFLHGLGLDAAAAQPLRDHLAGTANVVGIDLPGFGDARDEPATSVEEMVGWVERRIGEHGATRWGLIGHSMGGKIASIVADRAMTGESGLFGLHGIVLLAASPLTPEPMDEQRRSDMLAWADAPSICAENAATFVDANTADGFTGPARADAIASVTSSSTYAWRAWLQRGSREDWGSRAELSPVPALILAGAADGDDLGADAQQRLNVPRFTHARFATIEQAGHFIMLEQPEAVAELIADFWTHDAGTGPSIPDGTARMIASPRTSARTRGILARRALADPRASTGAALEARQLRVLRTLAAHVVPQDAPEIDLAGRVDTQLAGGTGDGWRNALLPADVTAYRVALDALAGWADSDESERSRSLQEISDGVWTGGGLTGEQMAAWFEDARVDLVRQWLAHPATMARIGFDGFANGGDGARIQGFADLGAGRRESGEPARKEY